MYVNLFPNYPYSIMEYSQTVAIYYITQSLFKRGDIYPLVTISLLRTPIVVYFI